jgi:hypothetical protein
VFSAIEGRHKIANWKGGKNKQSSAASICEAPRTVLRTSDAGMKRRVQLLYNAPRPVPLT